MASVEQHYATHLGPVYSWMVGDLDAAFARSVAELDDLPLPQKHGATALDLGAGFGLHALPLARRGYAVTALDSSERLLGELAARAQNLPIKIVQSDIAGFGEHVTQPLDVMLCMGDTLPHLPSVAAVDALFTNIAASLASGGVFAATLRDYSCAPPLPERRFILVRSDAARILTCCLEYEAKHVNVYDLLHERTGDAWQMRVSSYKKLRLDPQWITAKLTALGLTPSCDSAANGMLRIVAVRP